MAEQSEQTETGPVRLHLGIVWYDTLIWETQAPVGRPVTVGSAPGNAVTLPEGAGVPSSHALLVPAGRDAWLMTPPPGAHGTLWVAGRERALDPAVDGRGVPLGWDDGALVGMGSAAVFCRVVRARERVPGRPWLAHVDPQLLASVIVALIVHLGFVVSAFAAWQVEPVLRALDADTRLTTFITARSPDPPPPPETSASPAVAEPASPAAAPGPDLRRPPERPRGPGATPRGTPERLPGALRALARSGALRSVLGDAGGLEDRLDASTDGLGPELVGDGGGSGVLIRGEGGGGDASGFGPVPGVETGRARGAAKLKRRSRPQSAKVAPRRPDVDGGYCRAADIQRVVSARSAGIRYCYERALKTDPELAGTLGVAFLIGRDGRTQRVTVDRGRLGDARLAGCVKRAVARWRFPKPDGGVCHVRYPFVLNPGPP